MIVGYARVSTEDQKVDLQRTALTRAGCDRIYEDLGKSGAVFERKGLDAALTSLKPDGTLVVWRLDRLGRSLAGLVSLIDQLGKRRVHFRSIMENIDTTTSGGRLMFHMMAALAEFERALIGERTRAGLAEAKARGRHIGRPRVLTPEQIENAIALVYDGQIRLPDVAGQFGVSTRTLQRCIREMTGTVDSHNCQLDFAIAEQFSLQNADERETAPLQLSAVPCTLQHNG